MSELRGRVARVLERIDSAARRARRDPGEVRLVAVSKGFPAERVAEAAALGLRAFGENRVQEASGKIPRAAELCGGDLEWHMIGRLQRNKARQAAALFACIHSVDRADLADALERAASERGRPLRVLLQVNLEGEEQKGGAAPETLPALLETCDALSHLRPCGLMLLPRACEDPEEVRPSFARLRELRDRLDQGRAPEARLRELSMGMTADFEIAIEEGATLVRVGTALFGERPA